MFGPCFGQDGEPIEALGAAVPAAEIAELRAVGVDDKLGEAGGIRGVVIAEARTFFSSWRGRFNRDSLTQIIELWPTEGLKSAAQHPSMIDDGLFNYLGRIVTPRMSRATYSNNGETSLVPAVRGDLVFDPGARNGPKGDLATYISERVRSDPQSLSTSLIVAVNKIDEVDKKGRPKKGKDGEELPPLWMPLELLESDVVAAGDAVTSILSPAEKEETPPPYDSGRDAMQKWYRHRLAQHQEAISAGSHGTSG
jgi:hypothetical protein